MDRVGAMADIGLRSQIAVAVECQDCAAEHGIQPAKASCRGFRGAVLVHVSTGTDGRESFPELVQDRCWQLFHGRPVDCRLFGKLKVHESPVPLHGIDARGLKGWLE